MKYQHRFNHRVEPMAASNLEDAIFESDLWWGFPPRTTIKFIIGGDRAWFRTHTRGWEEVRDRYGDLHKTIEAMLRCQRAYQLV